MKLWFKMFCISCVYYITGNLADSATFYRKPRKHSGLVKRILKSLQLVSPSSPKLYWFVPQYRCKTTNPPRQPTQLHFDFFPSQHIIAGVLRNRWRHHALVPSQLLGILANLHLNLAWHSSASVVNLIFHLKGKIHFQYREPFIFIMCLITLLSKLVWPDFNITYWIYFCLTLRVHYASLCISVYNFVITFWLVRVVTWCCF